VRPVEWGCGVFRFEVLAKDGAALARLLGKTKMLSLDGDVLFRGKLEALELCQRTHPALSLLRQGQTQLATMTVHEDMTTEPPNNRA
jgi:hypothetical protein